MHKQASTYKTLLLFTFCLTFQFVLGQNVIINEIQSSNNSTISDCDGDFSDWIEIYNTSGNTINLHNFHISDDLDDIMKWKFPEINIGPGSYMVIFASGKDKLQDNELHTNFKIKQDGEPILFSNPDGEITDQLIPIYIPTDNSFSKVDNNHDVMVITEIPTPGAENIISEEIFCSHPSGFYANSFQLELFGIEKNAEIHFTRDGSTPTIDSPLYTSPLTIEDISNTEYSISGVPTTPLEGPYQLYSMIWIEPESVYKCNVIRYAVFKNGNLDSKVYSKTYFVDPEIQNRYSFPLASIIVDSLSLFDYDTGIYIPGKRFDENGFNWFAEGNYHNRGREWERKVALSYFDKDGNIAFETDAGIRMRGFGSTSFPQKSINVYLRSEYGLKNTAYPLFDNPQTEKYKRFIFRTGGNDFLYARIRDAMLHEVMSTMDLEIMEFKPMILFINGEYWGIHNLREKYDEYYFKYKYDIDEENINILGICGDVEEGDNTEYMEILGIAWNNETISDEIYSYINDRIDINNFIDFQIAEIFFANYDWPCNNYKIWKDNSPNSKWRFLIYDLDYSFGYSSSHCSYTAPFMEHATSEENYWPFCGCSNILFRKLLTNESFKEQFLSRFAFHLNNTLTKERIIDIIDSYEDLFADAMPEHIQRWHYPANYEQWEHELDILREFAENRPTYMIQDLVSFFNLTEFDIKYIESVDDIVIYPSPNNGFFALYNNSSNDIFDGDVTLISSSGRVVIQENNISAFKNQPRYFNYQGLPKGAYIFIFESNDIVIKKKMLII